MIAICFIGKKLPECDFTEVAVYNYKVRPTWGALLF
jgi:hypothetical protein